MNMCVETDVPVGGGDGCSVAAGFAETDMCPYRIDNGTNLFSVMRSLRRCEYTDALGDPSSGDLYLNDPVKDKEPTGSLTLFWTGCTLSSYTPDLAMKTFGFLIGHEVVTGLTTRCCSSILRYVGDKNAFVEYRRRLARELIAARVTRIVVACPGCYHNLVSLRAEEAGLSDVDIRALPEVLLELGVSVVDMDPESVFCVHDSCPDRSHGVFATALRALLSGFEIREAARNRRSASCCGMGRLQSLRRPELSTRLIDERITELAATGADSVVAGCLTCVGALQPGALHYLELVFGDRIDWSDVYTTMEMALALSDTGSFETVDSPERFSLG